MSAERPLRIAFDARHAGRGLGISTFITSLASELISLGGTELTWLGDRRYAPVGIARSVPLQRFPYPLLDGPAGRALARHLGVDVVHFTGNTGWTRPGPVPTVMTLHDLIFLRSHGRDRSLRQIVGHRYERWLIVRAVHCIDAIVVPSGTVAADVGRRLGAHVVPRIVYEGVAQARPALRLPSRAPYVVAFAGRDPRKRTAAVVDGWRMVADLPLSLTLLASAGLPDGLRESLASEVAAGKVEILEHVPRETLIGVIQGACALAYPSSDEGFGLPVLEAMAVGTPVLSGLAPVTREIGGGALVQLDAQDIPGSIAAGLRRLREDEGFKQSIMEKGRQRAASFTWAETAKSYDEIYREISRDTSGSDR